MVDDHSALEMSVDLIVKWEEERYNIPIHRGLTCIFIIEYDCK